MTWIESIKGLFRKADIPEGNGQSIRVVSAAANPYGVDLWDCTAFTQTMISTSGEPNIAARFVSLRGSAGDQHRGQVPADASVMPCDLSYAVQQFPERPLFKADAMADKWDIYFFSPHIYFARSWTGQLIYRATVRFEHPRMFITQIECAKGHEPEFGRRAVDYLVRTHVLGTVIPHPLPGDLPPDPAQVAAFSFSTFGRRCACGTYADTTLLSVKEDGASR